MVFDVGEVVVDETTEYSNWAKWLGVSPHEFSAVFGWVIGRGGDYRDTFLEFQDGFDLTEQRRLRAEAGFPETFTESDLYPDIRDCLIALRNNGLQVGLAGNQTARAEEILISLDLDVDWIRTSDGFGVEKPAPEFFERVIKQTGVSAEKVLYVGDRLDNDVRPAQQVGMQTVLVKRGPWGRILSDPDVESACLAVVSDLRGLPGLVAQHNASAA
ncbi:HAD family hydrolase [Lentzea sp. NPDC102401]|uniref:HAD family hydrolase n=1 Tax=Lentzea sp. NPDC102401 TaxID=3364128 RepID=UPI00380B78AC